MRNHLKYRLIHITMYAYITVSTIATVIRRGLEDKCELVGQGSFASPNACHVNNCHSCVWRSTDKPQQYWHHGACGVACHCGMLTASALAVVLVLETFCKLYGRHWVISKETVKNSWNILNAIWENDYHQNQSNGFISIEMKPKLVTKSEFDYSLWKAAISA